MQALTRALQAKEVAEPAFNGTASAAAKSMVGVSHQSLGNLLLGITKPWRVNVHLMNQLVKLLGSYGLKHAHFATPRDEIRRLKGAVGDSARAGSRHRRWGSPV